MAAEQERLVDSSAPKKRAFGKMFYCVCFAVIQTLDGIGISNSTDGVTDCSDCSCHLHSAMQVTDHCGPVSSLRCVYAECKVTLNTITETLEYMFSVQSMSSDNTMTVMMKVKCLCVLCVYALRRMVALCTVVTFLTALAAGAAFSFLVVSFPTVFVTMADKQKPFIVTQL